MVRPWSGEPCYVGKGKDSRYLAHQKAADKHRNPHLANIFSKAKRLGLAVPVFILKKDLSEAVAFEYEKLFVELIGRSDRKEGTLCNHTDGGEGTSGYIFSPEVRSRMGKSHTGLKHSKKTREKMSVSRTGHETSEVTREKLRIAHTGRTITEEWRAKISQTLKGRPNPERVAALAVHNKGNTYTTGHTLTAEHKAKISAAHTGMKRSEEAKAKMRLTWTGRQHSAETKEKMRISALARREREKQSRINPNRIELDSLEIDI